MDDGSALLAPFTYIGIPTLLDLTGWNALMVGVAATWLTGAMFDLKGMTAAAIGIGAVHVGYSHFNDELSGLFGDKELWNFGDESSTAGFRDQYPGVYGLHARPNVVTYPDGQQVLSYGSPHDAASVGDSYMLEQGMQDSYVNGGMMDAESDYNFESAY